MKHDILVISFLLVCAQMMFGQSQAMKPISISQRKQQSFSRYVPAGNYSGIVHLKDNQYALVSDKSNGDGYFVFDIDIDSLEGDIRSIKPERFAASGLGNRDEEGIALRKADSTLYISGEADNRILQYTIDGRPTGRELEIPTAYKVPMGNYGFESLCYNDSTHKFWTANESTLTADGPQATSTNGVENIIRIQAFDDQLKPQRQYMYRMDAPTAHGQAANYAMGVSELLAMDDGSVLVLEREFFVPPSKLGAFVNCKLYQIWPTNRVYEKQNDFMEKKLVGEIHTSLSLFNYSIANYEGMCMGPKLADGRQTIIMVSDSQNQYAGVLKDWFKVLVVNK